VGFQLAARENLQHLLRKCGKILRAALAQVPPGQFVIPVFALKLLDGALVDRLFLCAQAVAFQESCELLVESGIYGIEVECLPPDGQRRRQLLQRYQTCDITIEDALVFRRACSPLTLRSSSRNRESTLLLSRAVVAAPWGLHFVFAGTFPVVI